MEEGIEDIGDGEVALYTMYNPKSVAVVRTYKNHFVQPVHVFKDQNEEDCVVVHLTMKGNTALREVCHTVNQHAVWCFPLYKFIV